MSDFSFTWFVHEDGYEWTRFRSDYVLRPRIEKGEVRTYSPLSEFPCLCRAFADMQNSSGDYLWFANKYGPLFSRGQRSSRRDRETCLFWSGQLHLMGTALLAWDGLNMVGKDDALRKRVVELVNMGLRSVSRAQPPKRLPLLRSKQLDESQPMRLRVVPDGERGYKIVQTYSAYNLIHALWLQVSQLVIGKLRQQRCLNCQAWFDISPTVGRSDGLYCHVNCRVAHYRKRKKAKQLHEQGQSLVQIAEVMSVMPGTVALWL